MRRSNRSKPKPATRSLKCWKGCAFFGHERLLLALLIPFAALFTGVIVQGIGLQITLVGFAITFLVVTAAAALTPVFKGIGAKASYQPE